MGTILRAIDGLSDWSGKVFSFLVGAIMFIIAYEVVARYVFNSPTVWASESVTYFCGIYAVMGGAYTLRLRGHANVDIVYAHLSPRMKAIVDLATFPFFFLFFGVLLWTGADYSWESLMTTETTGTAWNPPIYPVRIMIPIAALLILLQGFAKFIRDFKGVIKGEQAE